MAPRVLRSGVLAATLASLAVAAPAASAAVPVTPAGWRVTPVGSEIAVDRAQPGLQGPLGAALSPDGGRLLTTSSGAAKLDSVDLFDLGARTRTSIVPYDATKAPGQALFYGVAFSPDGRKAWASGGGQQVVHAYDVDDTTEKKTTDVLLSPATNPCRRTTRPRSRPTGCGTRSTPPIRTPTPSP